MHWSKSMSYYPLTMTKFDEAQIILLCTTQVTWAASHVPKETFSVMVINFYKLYKWVETQTTNQQRWDHGQWPEANVGQSTEKDQIA